MSKPLEYFAYQNGVLSTHQASLLDIAKNVSTPSYVYSESGFLKPTQALLDGLSGWDSLVCYAVKSNSNISILSLLGSAGAGMDIVSGGELYRCAAASIPGDKIVFSGVGKTETEIQEALEYGGSGIFSFHIESASELASIALIAKRINKRAPVALRFNPDIAVKTHPYISTGLKKDKFGLQEKECLSLFAEYKSNSHIDFKGVSLHIGSQILSLNPLEEAFKKSIALIKKADKILEKPLGYVDIGGGLGIAYQNEKFPSIKSYCALIRKSFSELKKNRNLKVVMEPGRLISGNAGVLLTKVIFKKQSSSKNFLIVDAAMNDLIRPSLYESHHEIVPVVQPRSRSKLKKFDVVGPVCESGDFIAMSRLLPDSIQEGDMLAILSAGAYGFSMASNYNSRPRAPEVLVADLGYRIIRQRESYEDLIRPERFS